MSGYTFRIADNPDPERVAKYQAALAKLVPTANLCRGCGRKLPARELASGRCKDGLACRLRRYGVPASFAPTVRWIGERARAKGSPACGEFVGIQSLRANGLTRAEDRATVRRVIATPAPIIAEPVPVDTETVPVGSPGSAAEWSHQAVDAPQATPGHVSGITTVVAPVRAWAPETVLRERRILQPETTSRYSDYGTRAQAEADRRAGRTS